MATYRRRRPGAKKAKAHQKRAQKRKAAFGGLAAFCQTHPQGWKGRPRNGRLG